MAGLRMHLPSWRVALWTLPRTTPVPVKIGQVMGTGLTATARPTLRTHDDVQPLANVTPQPPKVSTAGWVKTTGWVATIPTDEERTRHPMATQRVRSERR